MSAMTRSPASREQKLERLLRMQRASVITAVVVGVLVGVSAAAYVLMRSQRAQLNEDADAPLFV